MKTIFILSIIVSTVYSQEYVKNAATQNLDYESQQCMKCHNGSNGHTITVRENGMPIEYDELNRTKNHSMGMNYISSYRKDSRHYISPALLNSKIILVDGKVGCVSCHVAKNRSLASNSISFPLDESCSFDKKSTEEAFQNGLCNQCHQK
jgi:hypothetical protein